MGPTVDELRERATRVLPGGATHAARVYSPPMYVDRALGSRKWLVDGREVIDYTMGHGALLLGHAHPAVVDAVQRQVARGTHYGAAHPFEVEWAELICAMVASVDEVRFTASGTEAAMLALRVARAATGRDVVLKLDHHFHGWSDAVSVNLLDSATMPEPGVATVQGRTTRVARDGDIEALRAALAPGDVAALLLEASGAHYGGIPLPDGYVAAALAACRDSGTLLVVDEVVTGFRVAPGGLQSVLGVQPDLTIFGKVMAGGLPGGAVGGRRDLMELLSTRIAHFGTFNANPLTASAGIATLSLCTSGEPQRVADGVAVALQSGWEQVLQARGVAGGVRRLASILHLHLDDADLHAAIGDRLRAQGVDLLHSSAFCSAAHTGDDVAATVDALDHALTA